MTHSAFKVIGLCGRSGSGKGYICNIFASCGIPCVDTDKVYRHIVAQKDSECIRELVSQFGNEILTVEGTLNRKALAPLVFSDEKKLARLNSITHKYILAETEKLIEELKNSGAKAVIIDAPVLFESGFNRLCDLCVCVTCGTAVSVKRITQRDGIDEQIAEKRLSSQLSEEELRALCDYEIVNDDVADPKAQVIDFVKRQLK